MKSKSNTVIFSLVLLVALMLIVGGGSKSRPAESAPAPSVSNGNQLKANMGKQKILIAYFSMPETTKPNNMTVDEDNSTVVIDGEVLGNTQYIAYIIQKNSGADIFRIEPKTAYPTDHRTLVDLANREQRDNARPELRTVAANIKDYDVIFLGYPTWCGDLPMILYSFLEGCDLSGKTIVPFNTHGGSGLANTISEIAKLQPRARVVRNGFTVSRNRAASAENDVTTWLSRLDISK